MLQQDTKYVFKVHCFERKISERRFCCHWSLWCTFQNLIVGKLEQNMVHFSKRIIMDVYTVNRVDFSFSV